MKFALANEQRQEARPNLSGQCPACSNAMVAKCGKVRIWHWAHKGRRHCDPWWENETEWHRAWKGQFPESWQEVVHSEQNGTIHIADVKTKHGWVIEFQHSHIKPEERRSRDAFYSKLVWVVDGTRRKRDAEQLSTAWSEGTVLGVDLLLRRVRPNDYSLFREWEGSDAPIYIDFGGPLLCCLFAAGPGRQAYIGPFSRAAFIETHRGATTQKTLDFDKWVTDLVGLIAEYEKLVRALAMKVAAPDPLGGFQQYLAHRSRRRRRF